ncbi:response regulator transcription factor [Salmonella enterica subsp. enterica serovar Urbana]|nr:response regulator transcription factor [Salmonella enterica subsp. enterica serovar Urbana]
MMKIIIIGDRYLNCHHIMTSLIGFGETVDHFSEFDNGLCSLATANYCAAIVFNPPKAFMKKIPDLKSSSNVAVIALHENGTVADRIHLFNAGVDDYMKYPVDIQELQIRVKAAVRRRNNILNHTLAYHDIAFDFVTREVFLSGIAVNLTFKEKCLLEIFFLNKGRILSKQHLHDKLFSWNKDISSNVVEVYISSLRKKLGRDCITTFSGQGYRLG